MSTNTLELKLLLTGAAGVEAGVNKAFGVLKRRMEEVKAFNKQIENGSAALNTVLQQTATVLGFSALRDMAHAAQEVTIAQVQLQRALVSTGQYSKEAEESLIAQAEALETLTGAGNETTLSVQRMLLSQGATVDQVKQLTPLVLDLAANMGVDAVTAARQLGAALDGQALVIGKLNIQATSFNGLIKGLTNSVGGQAEALQKAKGGWGEMAVAANQAKESIGGVIEPRVGIFLSSFVESIQKSSREIRAFAGESESLGKVVNEIARALGDLAGSKVVLAIAGLVVALTAVKGVVTLLSPALNILRAGFVMLTGMPFLAAISGLQTLTVHFGASAASAYVFSTALGSVASLAQLLAGSLGVVGAALAGWTLGKLIGELEVFGVKINDLITYNILRALEVWEKFKNAVGITSDAEYRSMREGIEKTKQDILVPPQKTDSSPVNKPADKDQTAAEKKLVESAQKLAIAKAEAVSKIEMALNARDMARIEQQYDDEAAIFEQFLDQKKALLESDKNAVARTMAMQMGAIDEQLAKLPTGADAGAADDTKRNELLADRQALLGQLAELQIKHQQQLEQLDTDWNKERVKRFAEAEAKRVELTQEAVEKELKIRQQELQVKGDMIALDRARVQNDFRLTDVQRREKELDLLGKEKDMVDQMIAALRERLSLVTDPAAIAAYEDQIRQLEDRSRGLGTTRAGEEAKADPNSISQQMQASLIGLQNQFGTFAQSVATGMTSVIGSAVDGIAGSISGLLNRTMTWGQALKNIGGSIMNGVVNAFSKMAAEWIAQRAIIAAKEILFSGQETAAKAPSALLSSISSWGLAALIGGAAFMGIMAAVGGFESGGYTGDGPTGQVAGLVHRREVVFDSAAVSAIGRDRLEAMRLSRSIPAAPAGGVMAAPASGSGSVNVAPPQVHVLVFDDPQKLSQAMDSGRMDDAIVRVINRNKLRVGINS